MRRRERHAPVVADPSVGLKTAVEGLTGALDAGGPYLPSSAVGSAERVLRTLATDIERTEAGVQVDLGSVPPSQAVSALVAAGVAVNGAAPRAWRSRLTQSAVARMPPRLSDGCPHSAASQVSLKSSQRIIAPMLNAACTGSS